MKGIVRRAAPEELEGICGLFRGAVALMDRQGIPQWDELYPTREDFRRDIRRGEMYTVRREGETDIAAVFVLNRERDPQYEACDWREKRPNFLVLHRLCVNAERQHQGLGALTLLAAEETARDLGAESVRLDAFSRNPYALQMYEKAGYERRGKADFRKGLFYLYEKKL